MERKNIWMKHLTTGLINSLFFTLLVSCSVEPSVYKNFTYTNQSGYDITITTYRGNLQNEISIDDNSSITQRHKLPRGVPDNSIFYTDSVEIIFSNSKTSKFNKIENSQFNILNNENYEDYEEDGEKYFNYTFTIDDYNAAAPIE